MSLVSTRNLKYNGKSYAPGAAFDGDKKAVDALLAKGVLCDEAKWKKNGAAKAAKAVSLNQVKAAKASKKAKKKAAKKKAK